MRQVAVLGATGAIGSSALKLIHGHPERYRARVLTAYRDVDALAAQCVRHRPELAVIADPALEGALARRLAAAGVTCDIASGPGALAASAASGGCDTVIVGIAGSSGIEASLAAARSGKHLLLGNRESAVVAGPLLRQALDQGGGGLIPLQSELFAAFVGFGEAAPGSRPERLVLAGAGGPLAGLSRAQLVRVTPAQLGTSRNPRELGAAVGAACLMRDGLLAIAAKALLRDAPDRIEAMIQPQAQTHVRIEYDDGQLRIQPGAAMLPEVLARALAWPASAETAVNTPDATAPAIEQPDLASFRCLALAYHAMRAGGDAATILNAAYEVAVEAFLAGSLSLPSVADLVEQILMELPPMPVVDTQTLSERDRAARGAARRVLRNAC
ncbi:1-deoxy-D-xylulose-5-phosphate reductoisomerase [Dyella acidiphila]|uniref:1-deoxy-D-xylulose-5-phosphate reductoisomerase n=1 Tax=Dyella acidiphila TaxID=2775866 RepID=A0ABR9GC85_9GAMM|nr:1-deoxy-D-xylulose-5-phosphate reductoisomerase [Dyella acidiphila]MBE1161633.1 1-deoxy-D-xylulose-5-phosphate reductoisomerase [Dyella acidiphila]